MGVSLKKIKSNSVASRGRKRAGTGKPKGKKGRGTAKKTEVNEITATLVKLTIVGCFLGILIYVIVSCFSGK